jgi:hypothetical protein
VAAERGLHLFAVLVGGSHPRASIELHDLQFVAANSIDETIPVLRARWWGTPGSLHVDAYAEIRTLDGYRVEPMDGGGAGPSLYFVNTGGYRDGVFAEEHAYSFHVGADKRAVWAAAKARATFGQKHQDNFDAIDDVVCASEHLAEQRLGLRLTPAPGAADDVRIVAAYIKLDT